MFFVLLLAMVMVILMVIILPQASGLFTYTQNPAYLEKKIKKDSKRQTSNTKKKDDYGGYIPPDEQEGFEFNANGSEKKNRFKSFGTGVYTKLNSITEADIPIKMKVKGDVTGLKKRGSGVRKIQEFDRNPDNYDYDLNDLIEEELENDRKEAAKDSQYSNDYNDV